ncbi:hypothetical protein WOLCODRAFT_139346 [Wolfiporia cocos MD-104 SS10]|uniref:Uncharacterized protein n=1 Tax=Wolfiporia cocos (strain MD-104) TaxID=742152 RepID=A0A2H3JTR5_WOLCO|nr:hypothetical protein WOLCODRAFT_139346 [Wolfiporia cocos MD-104 SS10]
MSWVVPQQYPQWPTMAAAPAGWQGSWPPTAPTGYPGPPPIPTGVNPQAWMAGQWQLNPYFRGPAASAHGAMPAWAPHPSWGAQAANAAAANYNPYKRIPNPGGADYWATKVSDNGLMLEGMHIREDAPAKIKDNGVLHTPWVWAPRELSKSPERRDSDELRDGQGDTTQQVERGQSRDASSYRDYAVSSSDGNQNHHPRTTHSTRGNTATSHGTAGQSHIQESSSSQRRDALASRRSSDRMRYEDVVIPEHERVVPPFPASMTSYPAYVKEQQQRQHHHHRDVSPRQSQDTEQRSRDSRPPVVSSASAAAAASAIAAPRPTAATIASASEAFSSKRELRTTFSPSIIRTPDHYSVPSNHRTSSRRASYDDAPSLSTPVPSSHRANNGYISGPLVSTSNRRASTDDTNYSSSRSSTLPRSNSSTYAFDSVAGSRSNSLSNPQPSALEGGPSAPPDAPSLAFLTNFSEELEGLLSPLIGVPRPSGGSSPSERDVARSQTYPPPSGFEPIPEDRAVSQPRISHHGESLATSHVRTPSHSRASSRSTHTTPESGARQIARSHSYPLVESPASSPISPTAATRPSPSRARSRGPSPSRTAHASHNPLPPPPMPSYYQTSTASTAASASATQSRAATYRTVRKGFWNCRGDHLLVENNGTFIVYAPHNKASPRELAQYPSPLEGFMDHHGHRAGYDPSVPELPESLPRHGEPPLRPYDSFLQYVQVRVTN